MAKQKHYITEGALLTFSCVCCLCAFVCALVVLLSILVSLVDIFYYVMVLFVICVRLSRSHTKGMRTPACPGIEGMRQYLHCLTIDSLYRELYLLPTFRAPSVAGGYIGYCNYILYVVRKFDDVRRNIAKLSEPALEP